MCFWVFKPSLSSKIFFFFFYSRFHNKKSNFLNFKFFIHTFLLRFILFIISYLLIKSYDMLISDPPFLKGVPIFQIGRHQLEYEVKSKINEYFHYMKMHWLGRVLRPNGLIPLCYHVSHSWFNDHLILTSITYHSILNRFLDNIYQLTI